ncbi:MAG TPA: T9SS type A sorting domain-containing protein [Bacteroidia bacterium]
MKSPLCKNHSFALVLILGVFGVKAQNSVSNLSFKNTNDLSSQLSSNWSSTWQTSKVFIENKGQFQLPTSSKIKSPISYGYDEGSTKILFTAKGVVYSFSEKKKKNNEEEKEEKFKNEKDFLEKEREEKAVSYNTDAVSVEWEGANENVQIISENKSAAYFSYTFFEKGVRKNVNYINGYNKLTYKNLYPNIDIEYVFHPNEGIEYSIILHPGADVSKVKLNYSNKIKLKDNGNIYIPTKFGDIIEHAPQTFYANNKSSVISSKYVKVGNNVSFQLGSYDATQTVVIDPWVQTPTIANSNSVWECEKDGAGNVYIIGGESPMKLLKYNAGGTLQWTYSTPWDTASSDWLGTFATDLAGNSYVTNGSTAALQKVNTNAGLVYSVTGGSMDEYWNIAFNCDQTKLIIGGTRLTGFPSITGSGVIFDINTSNGNVNGVQTVGSTCTYTVAGMGVTDPDEVRSITSSYNARYYYLTLDSMGAIDQDFSSCPNSSSLFKINHTYAFGYKCENYRPQNGNAGIMAIKANRYFVYTQNGTTISKRSLMTGAILSTVSIAGGISTASYGSNQVGNSGIDIDSCGNVYVGSGNAVMKYDANLNLLSSVSLPFAVYDVAVSYGGNVIVAGSTGTSSSTSRIGYVQSIPMSACGPMKLYCCDATVCPVGPFCTTSPTTTLSPVTAGGTWSGTGVNASGVFNPATAGVGTHTIVYTLACGSDSVKITVNSCATLMVCQSNNNITVSGGTAPYTWATPTTYTDCSSCPFGICTPPICNGVVTTSLTTIASGTNTITAPSSYPVIVTDNATNSYTITSLASIPTCTFACTTPTLSVNSATICAGSTATLTISGATTYSWIPSTGLSSTNSATVTATPQTTTTYTIQGVTTGTCSAVVLSKVTVLRPPDISVTGPAHVCVGNAINLGETGSASSFAWTGPNSFTSNIATPIISLATTANSGVYSLTATGTNGCSVTHTINVNVMPNPTVTVSTATMCAGNSGTLTANGASTYTWSTTQTGSSIVVTPTVSTTYTVLGTDATNCTNTASVLQIVSNCGTGIRQVAGSSEQVTVYPNPNNGSFTIETKYSVHCIMYDVNGREVLIQTVNGKATIDASNLAEGIYNLSIISNEGVINKRVVILR